MNIINFKDYLVQFIGQYQPDLTCQDWGQIDWVWICSFILMLHLIIFFFKGVKSIFKKLFGGFYG